ncbi:MAG: hypothetical protein M0D55_06240 [Elusimicrobiota bacterium]|nr:MAG: hypothetical protein M0D55_06240 [Elusimicrobiota bacterium]
MDEDRRIYVAVAVIALIAVGSLFVGRGGSRRGQAGTSFRSRLSAFGLAPDPGPSAPEPAAAAASASSPGAGLSAPEPMMTKAASRLFSNPSGATGGQPGAQEAPPAYASARAMNPSLVDSSPNFPGGSRSSSYSSAAPGPPRRLPGQAPRPAAAPARAARAAERSEPARAPRNRRPARSRATRARPAARRRASGMPPALSRRGARAAAPAFPAARPGSCRAT